MDEERGTGALLRQPGDHSFGPCMTCRNSRRCASETAKRLDETNTIWTQMIQMMAGQHWHILHPHPDNAQRLTCTQASQRPDGRTLDQWQAICTSLLHGMCSKDHIFTNVTWREAAEVGTSKPSE
jgi:hypothetical protein